MAVVTINAAGNVVGILAGCDDAIVTGATSADYVGMIDGECRRIRIRCMAVLADVGRLNVGRILADCIRTVVATRTIADDVRMVENSRSPGRCVVAVVALLTGRDMRRGFARRLHAVMAGVAIARYRRVVHKRDGTPCGSYMAVGTLSR